MAPRTKTPSIDGPTPSIWVKNSVSSCLLVSLALLAPRFGHNESISSTKTTEGALLRASSNSVLTNFADSPTHFETKLAEEMERKVVEAAEFAAIALAR